MQKIFMVVLACISFSAFAQSNAVDRRCEKRAYEIALMTEKMHLMDDVSGNAELVNIKEDKITIAAIKTDRKGRTTFEVLSEAQSHVSVLIGAAVRLYTIEMVWTGSRQRGQGPTQNFCDLLSMKVDETRAF